jgi:hypothetical protein
MKTSIDALVLIGHANKITHEVPSFVTADIRAQLSDLRSLHYSDIHDRTTETDMNNLLAAETFLALGSLATSLFSGQIIDKKYPNSYRETAIDIMNEISPFQKGTKLDPVISGYLALGGDIRPEQMTAMFAVAIGDEDNGEESFRQKWLKSVELFKRRGDVGIQAYRKADILEAIQHTNLEDTSPDTIDIKADKGVIHEIYIVENLIEQHTVPFYATFRQENAAEMFADSMMDLRELGLAIKSI